MTYNAFVRGIEQISGRIPQPARRFFEKNRFVAPDEFPDGTDPRWQKFTRAVSKPGQ